MKILILFLYLLFQVSFCKRNEHEKPGNRRLDVLKVQKAQMRWLNQTETHDMAGFDYSVIPKTMSTITRLVLCDVALRQRGMPKLNRMVRGNPCIENDWFHRYPRDQLLWQAPENRPNIIIFRDPIQRFVSMFGFLCKIRKHCEPGTNIHVFARTVYAILRRNKIDRSSSQAPEIFRHIQPASWFAYNHSNTLPPNPVVIYASLDLDENADQLRDALLKGNVPRKIAAQAVKMVRQSYVNTIRTDAGQRDDKRYRMWEEMIYEEKETLLHVLATYYIDYRLLKIELPEALLKAVQRHGITLPDPIEDVPNYQIGFF